MREWTLTTRGRGGPGSRRTGGEGGKGFVWVGKGSVMEGDRVLQEPPTLPRVDPPPWLLLSPVRRVSGCGIGVVWYKDRLEPIADFVRDHTPSGPHPKSVGS